MTDTSIATIYRSYIDCLNRQDWATLGLFVHEEVRHNGRPFGVLGYREMLESDYRQIPDLKFSIDFLVHDAKRLAARLSFDCTPKADFLGLAVNGRRVRFCENVFYEFEGVKIRSAWSIIDKAAIQAQLG